MGRIDATISDKLENEFRIEIIKRLGGRKGDLQKAVEEAIELWTHSDFVQKMKNQVLDEYLLPSERTEAIGILANMGSVSLDALVEISGSQILAPSERDFARKKIKEILILKK